MQTHIHMYTHMSSLDIDIDTDLGIEAHKSHTGSAVQHNSALRPAAQQFTECRFLLPSWNQALPAVN